MKCKMCVKFKESCLAGTPDFPLSRDHEFNYRNGDECLEFVETAADECGKVKEEGNGA